jgi:hypothetical protein
MWLPLPARSTTKRPSMSISGSSRVFSPSTRRSFRYSPPAARIRFAAAAARQPPVDTRRAGRTARVDEPVHRREADERRAEHLRARHAHEPWVRRERVQHVLRFERGEVRRVEDARDDVGAVRAAVCGAAVSTGRGTPDQMGGTHPRARGA